jgi:hypothetical protein
VPCEFSLDQATGKGQLDFHKGAQIVTSKLIGSVNVGFDSGGVMVQAVFPNARGTMNLNGLPFELGDHEHVLQVMKHHNIGTGG